MNPTSMRAVVLDAPGPPEALQVSEVPVPVPERGQVLIKVEAFGRNRSELHTRLGLADGGQAVPFASDLDWATLGVVPEMLQTSHGSLTIGVDARPGQSILIRGGTSSVGMATAVLARRLGMTVFATTRNPDRGPTSGSVAGHRGGLRPLRAG